jgi:hypothetical protein
MNFEPLCKMSPLKVPIGSPLPIAGLTPCIPIEESYQFSQIESWVAIMVLAWIAPFRLAATPSVE